MILFTNKIKVMLVKVNVRFHFIPNLFPTKELLEMIAPIGTTFFFRKNDVKRHDCRQANTVDSWCKCGRKNGIVDSYYFRSSSRYITFNWS